MKHKMFVAACLMVIAILAIGLIGAPAVHADGGGYNDVTSGCWYYHGVVLTSGEWFAKDQFKMYSAIRQHWFYFARYQLGWLVQPITCPDSFEGGW